MLIRFKLLFLSFLIGMASSFAIQNPAHYDSLQAILSKPVKSRIDLRIAMGYVRGIAEQNPQTGQTCFDQIKSLRAEILQNDLESEYTITQAYVHQIIGELDSADIYYDRSTELLPEKGGKYERKILFRLRSVLEGIKGNHEQALNYLYRTLEYTDTVNNQAEYAIWQGNIAFLYRQLKEYDKALMHLQKGLALIKNEEENADVIKLKLTLLNEMSNVYYYLQQYPKVLEMDLELLKLSEAAGNERQIAFNLNNIAEDYMQLERFEDSRIYNLRAIAAKKKLSKEFYLFSSYLNMVKMYRLWQPYHPEADLYLDSAISIASRGTLEQKQDAHLYARDLAKTRGNFKEAFEEFELYKIYQDSLFNQTKQSKISELEKKYETAKKEAENALLKDRLELNDQILNQQKMITYLTLGGLALLVLFLLFLLRVLSSRKRVNAILTTQSEQLQQLNDLKSEFFANISHELRTPLTLARGNVDLLISETKNQDQLHKLNNSRRSLHQLSRMVEDLLDLSKFELGMYKLTRKPVKLNTFLSRVVASFQTMSEDKEVALVFDDRTAGKVVAELDSRQFEKVVNNLIYNAFKFTSKRGMIRLELISAQQQVILRVIDTGAGIPEKDLQYIFDRFYQAANQNGTQGSGLGLAIAKEMVELHEGTIAVESHLGIGTTFTITLPVSSITADDEEELIDFSADDYVKERLLKWEVEKPHILLVEDNVEMQDYLREILGRTFRLTLASDGLEGLQLLKTIRPSLIISDVMMPGMNGFEFLKQVKSQPDLAMLPFILLTAKVSGEDKMMGLRLGVDDYITKPFDRDELLIKVTNLIDNLQNRLKWSEELVEEEVSEEEKLVSVEDEQMIQTIRLYLEQNIKDSKISVADMASQVAMSERQLYRKISAVCGMTPNQLIMEVRLQQARMLLMSGRIVKISQLAMEVGIGTPAYLSKQFFERFGKRPADYLD